ncbi:MAG: hypothetical protein J6S57_03150 [Alphaproteobacteria bacterium]|nr:hypothetical protein [Alphaproteobacteria bacterium]
MKKVLEFLKTNFIVLNWTVQYFVCLGLILWLLFNFNVLSYRHWWIFHHATLHGFSGLVFGLLMYSAIPIYIATLLIIYKKKEPIFTMPIPQKIKSVMTGLKNIFVNSKTVASTTDTKPVESEQNTESDFEYPTDMPREMYVPYARAKQHAQFSMSPKRTIPEETQDTKEQSNESIPIPSDFDISDSLPDTQPASPEFSNSEFPVFKDIDFDTPVAEPAPKLSNNTTKYFEQHNTEYETYHDFVATEKYVIYEHNDDDFWVMDDDNWFAAKKQRESPISELLSLAHQNDLTPVLYLASQNIMDIDNTIKKFESKGVRVIKSLEELE